jgi:hypothetical protein
LASRAKRTAAPSPPATPPADPTDAAETPSILDEVADATTRQGPAAKLERFTVQTMHRRELKSVAFHAREIREKPAKKLRAGIRRMLLLRPHVVFDRTSGGVIDGEKVIRQVDAILGTQDYSLQVSVVELTENEARQGHLLLNSDEARGGFDIGKFVALFQGAGEGFDIDATGYDAADMYQIAGGDPAAVAASGVPLEELGDDLRDARRRYFDLVNRAEGRDTDDYYTVLVFKDAAQCARAHERFGFDANRWQNGAELAERWEETNAQIAQLTPAQRDELEAFLAAKRAEREAPPEETEGEDAA